MTSRKIVAVFDSSESAQTARTRLIEKGVPRDRITIADQGSWGERKLETPHARVSFWTHVKEMFMPEHDRHTYEESLRRGGYLLVATVDEQDADETVACLEQAGAVDLNAREGQWRSEGWQPGQPVGITEASAATLASGSEQNDTALRDREGRRGPDTARDAGRTRAATPETDAEESERIPVVEERLVVGKREVNRGSVRVRSYIVEEPVHEEVRLREERVNVERRPVNEPARPVAKGAADDLMQERTVEVTETAEQAVVGKEARVTEQVVVGKDTRERVESIDDTVRRTKVEVEDGRTGERTRNPPPSERR
jgi:uncharacterized protein (TIGR02271 family)